MSTSGTVFSWGRDSHGQCARGAGGAEVIWPTPQAARQLLSARLVTVRCGTRHTAAVTREGAGYAWGIPLVEEGEGEGEGEGGKEGRGENDDKEKMRKKKSVIHLLANRVLDSETGLPLRRCRHVACCAGGVVWSVDAANGDGTRSLWAAGAFFLGLSSNEFDWA